MSYALTNYTNFHTVGTVTISSGDFGLAFTANTNTNITNVKISANTTASNARILNASYVQLGTASIVGGVATFSTPIPITAGATYYVLINNGNSTFVTDYGNVTSDLPKANGDITFPVANNAVFRAPYSQVITSLTTGGGNQLGIVSIDTDSTGSPEQPPTPTSDPYILFLGDSLTEGIAVPQPYPSLIVSPSNFTNINLGVSSKSAATIYAEADTVTNSRTGSNKTDDIIVVWAGSVDLYQAVGTTNAQNAFNSLKAYCLKEKALGAKVVVLTMLPRPNNTVVFSKTEYLAYNALIRAHWSEFADALADVQSDPTIGPDASNYNTAYYADTVHLTQAGYVIVARYVQDALHSINPAFPASIPVTPPVLTKRQRLINAGATPELADILLEIFLSN